MSELRKAVTSLLARPPLGHRDVENDGPFLRDFRTRTRDRGIISAQVLRCGRGYDLALRRKFAQARLMDTAMPFNQEHGAMQCNTEW